MSSQIKTADAASKSYKGLMALFRRWVDQRLKSKNWQRDFEKLRKDEGMKTGRTQRKELAEDGFVQMKNGNGKPVMAKQVGDGRNSYIRTIEMSREKLPDGSYGIVYKMVDYSDADMTKIIRATNEPYTDFNQLRRDAKSVKTPSSMKTLEQLDSANGTNLSGKYPENDEATETLIESVETIDEESMLPEGEKVDSLPATDQKALPAPDEGYMLPPVDEQEIADASQCKGKTQAGERCKNMTTNENGYCNDHQDQAGGKVSMYDEMMAMVASCLPRIAGKCYKVEFQVGTGNSIDYGDVGYGGSAYETRYTSVLVDAESKDVACMLADGWARETYGDAYQDLSAKIVDEFDSYEDYQAQYPYSSYEKIAFAESWNVYEVKDGIGHDEFGEERAKGYDGYYVIRYEDDGGAFEYGPYISEEEAMTVYGIPEDRVVFSKKADNFATAPRIPDEVDIDNDNADSCPLCGDPNFDGEFCNVCGYEEPPAGFDDIELETPEDYEEYERDSVSDELDDKPTFDPDEVMLDRRVEEEADDRADEAKDVEDEYGVEEDDLQFA